MSSNNDNIDDGNIVKPLVLSRDMRGYIDEINNVTHWMCGHCNFINKTNIWRNDIELVYEERCEKCTLKSAISR